MLIADDSKKPENREQHNAIAEQYSRHGIETIYFGQDEQLALTEKYTVKNSLQPVIGNVDHNCFYHKGASITRNITYLKLNELTHGQDEKQLFFFIDSDQEFKVNIPTENGEQNLIAVNYLYYLDQIFNTTDTTILTGKVVGDPPVSPAVMAGNLLDDLNAFLSDIKHKHPSQDCAYHPETRQSISDAAYHDMAEMFGFNKREASHAYECPVTSAHNHIGCFAELANSLSRFFFGEHPTRRSHYEFNDINESMVAARTIYTGNYVFIPEGLKYFIPFAPLKLRMAGPVLGRLIKADIDDHFMSANLPMLHKRTVDELGQSEFRPGVTRQQQEQIDISSEFERQFYGDIMLFSMEKLIAQGFPQDVSLETDITKILSETAASMSEKYLKMQRSIQERLNLFKQQFTDPDAWWNQSDKQELTTACDQINRFIGNIEHNFCPDSQSLNFMNDQHILSQRLQSIAEAIKHYNTDQHNWVSAIYGDS